MFVETGQGISREDVIAGYQIFLGRLPESETVIVSQMRHPNWEFFANALIAAAGRQCGINEVHLHGIEGEAGHIEFMSRHLGELMSIFYDAGWSLENEKPSMFSWRDGAKTLEALTTVDGIQVWRNPRVAQAQAT